MNLKEALSNIQTNEIWLKKSTEGQRYKYFKKEEIIAKLKPLLKEHTISYSFETKEYNYYEASNILIQKIEVTLYKDDEKMVFSNLLLGDMKPKIMSTGQAKGANETYFWKYMLSDIFMIPSSDKDLDSVFAEDKVVKVDKEFNALIKELNGYYQKNEHFKEYIKNMCKSLGLENITKIKDEIVLKNFITKYLTEYDTKD